MKKITVFAVMALGAITASAQAIEQPKFFDNWSVGIDGGATARLAGGAFFKSTRGIVGLHLQKQITPVLAMGVEGTFSVNTSSWYNDEHSKTMFDNSYVGAYAGIDLFNLFSGYKCEVRPFSVEAVLGGGWGHDYAVGKFDNNYFAAKAGLNFNFNFSNNLTFALKPAFVWNIGDADADQRSTGFDSHKAAFNLMAGLSYNFGPGFECVRPYNQAEINALNGQINDLRAQLDACLAGNAQWEAKAAALAAELLACQNRKPEVIREVNNDLNSVRYVFFKIGSSKVTVDQQPNIEMIAQFLKNHANAKVVVKGYASKDGPEDLNIRLANQRAQAVKDLLVKKYKIAADRITAEGQGIGEMFTEASWNRVSICTVKEAK